MKRKELGKISHVKFGIGGYQDAMLGLYLTFDSTSGWGVTTSIDTWDAELIECSQYAKWTEEDRSNCYDQIVRKISKLLNEAKVKDINDLVGIPVECIFDNKTNMLKDWRILTEVI